MRLPTPAPYNPTLSQLALTPGARLGPFEITALLGVGGMGEVVMSHSRAEPSNPPSRLITPRDSNS
jgi:hypothetical protein